MSGFKKDHKNTPVILIVGRSGAGKTTFIEKLIPELRRRGLRVGTIKHDVHGFEMDKPGKDSWRHKKAGSVSTIISSSEKIGMVMDVDHDFSIDELLYYFNDLDIILTEGFKRENRPKVEIFRPEVHDTPLCNGDDKLLALVSDHDLDLGVPRFGLEDINGVAEFLIKSCC
ncbi:MAG: molybdopterin-guanine dinucleotide biosynthesis protein B [Deltaproteobacteria bacterium]|nr:molybdopterin-guanine dinucleotide biosynthesis protein B [Deltaproteobacteria bacterium]